MLDKKFTENKEYKQTIKLMRQAMMEDWQINEILKEKETFEGWEPITFKELKEMSEEDLEELLSYCWKEGHPRCDTIGITDLVITPRESSYISGADNKRHVRTYYHVEFEDDNGGPSFTINSDNELIHRIGDGTWDYGLYKRVKCG